MTIKKIPEKKSYHKIPHSFYLIFFIMIIIFIISYTRFKKETNQIVYNNRSEISTIANLKANQINQWLQERLSDARYYSKTKYLKNKILKLKKDNNKNNDLFDWFAPQILAHEYEDIFIVDNNNDVIFSTSGKTLNTSPIDIKNINEIVRKGYCYFSDFFIDYDGKVKIEIISPLYKKIKTDSVYSCSIIHKINLYTYFFPLIQSWPTSSKTAETILVEKTENCDSVVYVNELKFRKNSAMRLKRSIDDTLIPAVRAACGKNEIFEGVDYRGEKVLSKSKKVEGTDWYIVTKIDKSEINKTLNQNTTWFIILCVCIFLFFLILIWLLWNRRRAIFYKNLLIAEQEKIAVENKFKLFFDNSPIGKSITYPDGRLTVNKSFCDMLGYSEEELQNINISDITHPCDLELSEQKLNEIQDDKISKIQFTKRYIHKNGKIIWVEVFSSLQKNDEGETMFLIASIIDITQKNQAEQLMKESEQRFVSLFQNNPACISINRLSDGKFIDVNNAFTLLLGYDREEFIGKTALDLNLWVVPEHRTEAIKQINEKGKYAGIETHWRKKSGDIADVIVESVVIDINGEKYYLGLVANITERKQAEKSLMISEEKFRNLYDDAPIGLYRSTPGGEIVLANKAIIEMLGYSSFEEISNRKLDEEWFEPSYPRKQFIDEIEKNGEVKDLISKWISHDGKAIFVKENAKIIYNSEGKIEYYDGTAEDITKQIEAEQELIESKEKYRLITENSSDVIFTMDIKTLNFTYISPSVTKLIGFSAEETMARNFQHFVLPEYQNILLEAIPIRMREFFEGTFDKENKEYEVEQLCKDGRKIWVGIQADFITDENGVPKEILGVSRNITKRKNAEKALAESEEKYRNIFNNIQDVYYEASVDGTIIEVSPSISQISNYTQEEFIGKSITDLYPDKKIREQLMSELLDKGIVNNYVIPLIDKNGEIIRCAISSKIILNEAGTPFKIVGSLRNIEETKRIEEARLESELKYSELVNNASDIIFSFNMKGIVKNINPIIEKILHYKTEEIIDKSVFVSPSSKRNALHKLNEKVSGQSDSAYYEIDMITKEGDIRTFDLTTFMRYSNGKPIEIFGIARDITEKKKLTEELQDTLTHLESMVVQRTQELSREEELYRTTVNSLNDWIFVIDDQYNLVFVNKTLKDLFIKNGIVIDLIGKNIKENFTFINDETFELYKNVFANATEEISESEYYVFGNKYFSQLKIYPITRENNVIRIVTTIHDYTKLKLIEDEMRKNLDREKELNVLKSQFITTVSHEFRTPLAGILSSVQLLKRYYEKWDVEKKEKMYKQIFDAIEHTKAMLDDISLIDKSDNNSLALKLSKINLNELLEQIIEENIQTYGTDFKIISDIKLLSNEYNVDPIIIRHIVSNIISNAIKYSGNSREINFNVFEEHEKIIFNITDHGIGIPEKDRKFLFDPFYRASNAEAIQGTGFGLSIVKRFVDILKGEIAIESEVKKGTIVTITIPYENHLK